MTREDCIELMGRIEALPPGEERWELAALWGRYCPVLMDTPVMSALDLPDPDAEAVSPSSAT